jgi:hypothetical protein
MAMKKGEIYECTNSDCGCEINVIKASEAPNASRSPRCCCGEEMLAKEGVKGAMAGGGKSRERKELSR